MRRWGRRLGAAAIGAVLASMQPWAHVVVPAVAQSADAVPTPAVPAPSPASPTPSPAVSAPAAPAPVVMAPTRPPSPPVRLDHRKLLATHEAMIWATGLDAEAGQVTVEEFRKSVADFRSRTGRAATGVLTERE